MMVDEAKLQEVIHTLTPIQRNALLSRQRAVFINDCVYGRGATTGALRRKGIITGRMPYAELTEFGEAVCAALEAA